MNRGYSILFSATISALLFAVCYFILHIRAISCLAISTLSLLILLMGFYSPHRITTEEADINLAVYIVLIFVSLVFIALYTLGMAISDTRTKIKDNTEEIIDLYIL